MEFESGIGLFEGLSSIMRYDDERQTSGCLNDMPLKAVQPISHLARPSRVMSLATTCGWVYLWVSAGTRVWNEGC